MQWKQNFLIDLKREFENRPFTVDDAKSLGKYTRNVVNKLLSEFAKKGYISRNGRGIYSTRVNLGRMTIQPGNFDLPIVTEAAKILSKAGVDYMVTGLTVLEDFINMLPFRFLHLFYVRTGQGEMARNALNKSGIKAILNPKDAEEVEKALSLVDGDLIVIREKRELAGRANNFASMERALIDAYFEATRGKIPIPVSEVGRIMCEALLEGNINITKLTKIASRRGVDREIRGILTGLGLIPSGKKQVVTDNVRTILAVAER